MNKKNEHTQTLSIGAQFGTMSPQRLADAYKTICNEYVFRMLTQWGLNTIGGHAAVVEWVSESQLLEINEGEIYINMSDIRFMVDNAISYDRFIEWHDYNREEAWKERDEQHFVNADHWFNMNYRDIAMAEKKANNV